MGYEVAAVNPIGYPKDDMIKQTSISLEERLHYN
jgi:hypothetical protein